MTMGKKDNPWLVQIGYDIASAFDREITSKGYLKFILLGFILLVGWLLWKKI